MALAAEAEVLLLTPICATAERCQKTTAAAVRSSWPQKINGEISLTLSSMHKDFYIKKEENPNISAVLFGVFF